MYYLQTVSELRLTTVHVYTVEPRYSKPLNCGHLSITATCSLSQLHTHVYKLTPEMWPPQLSGQ